MNTQLIMLDTPILVSDEKIKIKDWVIGTSYPDTPIAKVVDEYGEEFTAECMNGSKLGLAQYDSHKIIAGVPSLPSIQFANEELEKEVGYINVTRMSYNTWNNESLAFKELYSYLPYNIGYNDGFKASESLNTKKFSLDDLITFDEFLKNFNSSDDGKYYMDNQGDEYTTSDLFYLFKNKQNSKIYNVEATLENNVYTITKILK